jgi:hypothetical protein
MASRFHPIGGSIMKKFVPCAAALFCIALAPYANAQEQQSFKSLITRGFDIKAVTFARGESTENRETFVITLQREKSVAVCFFSANAWITLSGPALDDARRCDVR